MKNQINYFDYAASVLANHPGEASSTPEILNRLSLIATLLRESPAHKYRIRNELILLVEQLIRRFNALMPLDYNLISGKTAIANAILDIDRISGSSFFQEIKYNYEVHVRKVISTPGMNEGLLNGRTGVVMGLLRLICYKAVDSVVIERWPSDFFLVQNLEVTKHGLSFREKDKTDIQPVLGLGDGNAGHMMIAAHVFKLTGNGVFKDLIYKLHGYQLAGYRKGWANYEKTIDDVDAHFNHINQFRNKNLKFFEKNEINDSFWGGTQGIIYSYFMLYNSFKDDLFLKQSLRGLNNVIKRIDYTKDNQILFILFLEAARITKQKVYINISNKILQKLSLHGHLTSFAKCLIIKASEVEHAGLHCLPYFLKNIDPIWCSTS